MLFNFMSINFFKNFFYHHHLQKDPYSEIKNLLSLVEKKVGYPDIKTLSSATDAEVIVNGKKILMFGSYNYLGLANNIEVKETAREFIANFGIGTGGVRLLTGNMVIHEDMEKLLADFVGHDASMSIASGFGTNAGVIPAVANLLGFDKFINARNLVIFSDEYNHASIVDGCRLSKAIVKIYRHNDINHLEQQLVKYKKYRKLIITDGVFSMDGDVAKLDKIIDLAKEYGALTMVDDAHSIGVLGKNGAGTAEHFDRLGQVDINMGTFSKGLGVSGGFVAGNNDLIKFLKIACRTYMFSDSLSPAIVGGIVGSLNFIKNNPEIREDLKNNYTFFNSELQKMGFSTFNSTTQIVPLFVGDDKKTMDFFRELFNYGIFAPAVRWPAVPKKTGRIRFSIMATHRKEQISMALNIIEKVGKKLKVI